LCGLVVTWAAESGLNRLANDEYTRNTSFCPVFGLPAALNSTLFDLVRYTLIYGLVKYCLSTITPRLGNDLRASRQSTHGLVVFGMDDCVPPSPFYKIGVKVSKFEALSLPFVDELMRPMMPAVPDFPVTAIASVGAFCRLPGANDQEEVWQLVSEERDFTNGIQQAG
jgi:hypothetical protein